MDNTELKPLDTSSIIAYAVILTGHLLNMGKHQEVLGNLVVLSFLILITISAAHIHKGEWKYR